MAEINRLGKAPREYRRRAGLPRIDSPLYSHDVEARVRHADRERRKWFIRELLKFRQVKVTVDGAEDGELGSRYAPWLHQQTSWLELAAMCHPRFALQFVTGEWNGMEFFRPRQVEQAFSWFTGQEVSVKIAARWTGHDLYRSLRDPRAQEAMRAFVEGQEEKQRVAIGRSMLNRMFRADRYLGVRIRQFEAAMRNSLWDGNENVARMVYQLSARFDYPSLRQLYQLIALGEIRIHDVYTTMEE